MAAMSTGGDDPKDKGRAQPPSTLAGIAPHPPRPGLPPPRSTHGGPPPPRSGSTTQTPAFAPAGQTPPGQPAPFSQPQAPSPFAASPGHTPSGQPPVGQPPAVPSPPPAPAQPPGWSPSQPAPPSASGASDPAWAQSRGPGGNDPAWAQPRNPGAIPEARLVESESSPIEQLAEAVGELPNRFVAFLKISTKRAFRLRIEPSEVLPDEREALAAANPPVTDDNLQAFLAWRRSVVFLVATILTILSIMGLVDSLGGSRVASSVRFVKLLPTLAEVAFCVICWLALREWTDWRKQRKWLFFGWLLFMLTPFLVFVYPLSLAVMDAGRALTLEQMRQLGYHGVYNRVVAPFAFAMIALLQLAPKVISLMPGLIRSSMVIKLLFPGASAPGWLIVMCAPLYAMIAYALLIIPYQFTASGWFIFGVLLIMIAQGFVTRSGFALARPLTQEEALRHIKRVRTFYMVLLITAALSIIGGLGLLVSMLHMRWTTVVTTLLKFEANVMILTTIGADLVVTNLDRARGYTEGRQHIEQETDLKIAAFVGLNAPPTPPPAGPSHL